MGKYTHLRGKLPTLPQDESYQSRVTEERQRVLGTADSTGANTAYLTRLYADARGRKATIEEELSRVNLTLEALEQMIVERLQEDQQTSLKLADGASIYLTDDIRPSVKDRDGVVAWLKSTGQEALLSVNPQTLKGLVRNLLENGQDLMPGVEVFLKTGIKFSGPKGA
jgi:hypothetical protein